MREKLIEIQGRNYGRLDKCCLILRVLKPSKVNKWGYSSAGRAPALQAGGQRFDPVYLHHRLKKPN